MQATGLGRGALTSIAMGMPAAATSRVVAALAYGLEVPAALRELIEPIRSCLAPLSVRPPPQQAIARICEGSQP